MQRPDFIPSAMLRRMSLEVFPALDTMLLSKHMPDGTFLFEKTGE
jgi:hypothetical protein